MTTEQRTVETPQTAVGNLAIALGMLVSSKLFSGHPMTTDQIECYVESVAVLAIACGQQEELRAFDLPESRKVIERMLK